MPSELSLSTSTLLALTEPSQTMRLLYFYSAAAQSIAAISAVYATFVAFRINYLWKDIEAKAEFIHSASRSSSSGGFGPAVSSAAREQANKRVNHIQRIADYEESFRKYLFSEPMLKLQLSAPELAQTIRDWSDEFATYHAMLEFLRQIRIKFITLLIFSFLLVIVFLSCLSWSVPVPAGFSVTSMVLLCFGIVINCAQLLTNRWISAEKEQTKNN